MYCNVVKFVLAAEWELLNEMLRWSFIPIFVFFDELFSFCVSVEILFNFRVHLISGIVCTMPNAAPANYLMLNGKCFGFIDEFVP